MKKFSKPYIIAEIGINHNGNVKMAIKLIRSAKRAGADAVKFQVFQPVTLARENSKKTSQQKMYTSKKTSLFNMWKKMALNSIELRKLSKECKKRKIDFGCSVFDKESLKIVLRHNPKFIKVASSDITDLFLLKLIRKSKKKVILSTGLSKEFEIRRAFKILGKSTTLLHCVSSYPCPKELSNLKRIESLKRKFKTSIGYSDHTIGNEACYAALVLGADVIEKHFTFNKKFKGADHILSADENDLKAIVSFAKIKDKLLGKGNIKPTNHELKNKKLFRKGLYFSKDLDRKDKININDILFARPETKLNIIEYKNIIGKKLKKNKKTFQEIKLRDLFK